MQTMLDRLSETCKEYVMEINVKKTKVMVMNGSGRIKHVKLNDEPLEQVTRFKYLESWITDEARCDDDIKQRFQNFLNKGSNFFQEKTDGPN